MLGKKREIWTDCQNTDKPLTQTLVTLVYSLNGEGYNLHSFPGQMTVSTTNSCDGVMKPVWPKFCIPLIKAAP